MIVWKARWLQLCTHRLRLVSVELEAIRVLLAASSTAPNEDSRTLLLWCRHPMDPACTNLSHTSPGDILPPSITIIIPKRWPHSQIRWHLNTIINPVITPHIPNSSRIVPQMPLASMVPEVSVVIRRHRNERLTSALKTIKPIRVETHTTTITITTNNNSSISSSILGHR